MDFVVVTYGPDLKLLRHFVASYELYYTSREHLYVFCEFKDRDLLADIRFPERTTLIYREDFPELKDTAPYGQQVYLKMMAHNIVSAEYYCIMDCDFLFVGPTNEEDFFDHGKPIWHYCPWVEGVSRSKWLQGSQDFISGPIDYDYCDVSQWVFKKSIAAKCAQAYDPKGLLNRNDVLEFLVYGSYAHRYHADEYAFTPSGTGKPAVVERVNQVPPTYLHLDPSTSFSEYRDSKCLQFWSYWDLAEQKMAEFLEDSQRYHFGQVKLPADRRELRPTVVLGDVERGVYVDVDGADADGWLHETVSLALNLPATAEQIGLDLAVPGNPVDGAWTLSVAVALDDTPSGPDTRLGPGDQHLTLPVPPASRGRRAMLTLRLGSGFRVAGSADQREFRARLTGLTCQ